MLEKNSKISCIAQKPNNKGLSIFSVTNTAQASLEYLMTYGWALILVATVVGILVFIIGFQGEVECSSSGWFLCNGQPMQGEDLILTLQNNAPFDIIINPYTGIRFDGRTGYAKISYQGKEYRFQDEEARIGKGTQFNITGIGIGSANNLSITYTDTSSGLTKDWETPIKPTQQEICNNGVSESGDITKIDCMNPECGECKYNDGGGVPVVSDTDLSVGETATIQFNSIKTKEAMPLNDTWPMSSAILYFNATDVGNDTKISAWYGLSPVVGPQQVSPGWNEIEIPISNEDYRGDLLNPYGVFSLKVNSGSFKISETPKVLVTLKKGGS